MVHGALVLSGVVLVINAVALLVMLIGAGLVLGSATGTPPWLWAIAVGAMHLFVLRRKTLNGTIASAMVIGAVNLSLLALIIALSLPHVRAEHVLFAEIPLVGGRPLDASLIGLVFGVVLFTYFGHPPRRMSPRSCCAVTPAGVRCCVAASRRWARSWW